MHDVNHAIAALREAMGLVKLEFDRNGDIELVIDKAFSVYLMKIDSHRIELVSRLTKFSLPVPGFTLRRLLEANFAATGTGRLAVDSNDGRVLYSEQVDVRPLDPDGFQRAISDFIASARYWQSDEMLDLVVPPEPVSIVPEFTANDNDLDLIDEVAEPEPDFRAGHMIRV